MSKILLAFNGINDSYIDEAIQCRMYKPQQGGLKWIAAAACLLLVVLGLLAIPSLLNQESGVQRPQYIYQVGDTCTSYYGSAAHMGFDDGSVTFSIKSNKQWTYCFDILVYDYISDNERLIYVATTDGNKLYGAVEGVLTDAFQIYVDGVKCASITIPADGREHEVKIDFSYLLEAGYEVNYSCSLLEFGRFTLYRNN